jgi:adenylate kinase
MGAGGYVDDETTNAIVAERLAATDCRDGFLLDGYLGRSGRSTT